MAGSTNRILAGGNKVAFVTVDDGATPTVGASWAYVLDGNILSTSIAKQDSGQFDISIEHVEDNAALQTFLEASIITTSGGIEELLFEDGTRELASTSSNTKYIAIVRGGLAGGVSSGKRKVGVMPQRISSTSGGWDQAGETYNRVTLEGQGFKLAATVSVSSGLLTGYLATPIAVTLGASLPYGTVVYN
jgi:hypothetical protein